MSSQLVGRVRALGLRLPWQQATEIRGYSKAMMLSLAMIIVAFSGDLFRYTIGWTGYGLIVLGLGALSVVVMRRRRPKLHLLHLPYMLVAFVSWCWLSVLWSGYQLETVAGAAIQTLTMAAASMMAVSLGRFQFLRTFAFGMRLLVYGSLLFELGAALFAPYGVVPPTYLRTNFLQQVLGDSAPLSAQHIPGSYYWTHSELFQGGPLQGLMGNRNLLALVALLAIITTLAELADGMIVRWRATLGVLAGIGAIVWTDSATVYVTIAFVALGAALVVAGRRLERGQRWMLYASVGTVLVVGAVLVIVNNNAIFAMMNRSSDMSGRGTIWRAVINLGVESPVLGQGWISYWAPWLPEFQQLAIIEGVPYHQAHNAFLDVWMQTGTIGALLFAALVFTALVRTWWLAIDLHDIPLMPRPKVNARRAHPSYAVAAPFFLTIALTVQAMTESRLLIEGNWLLLCYLAMFAKLRSSNAPLRPRQAGTVKHADSELALDLRVD
ncbi:O-antigen ligase family protein [Gulosibacter bifidus]|uniref:O-antigen ligase family protein n=1 Tax=Gulosibacter bifidus TaxID=272239 RepID=A0ABW5RHJ3_9MICO|nr:O-antigen ligase family protein [Gulosibacter bifidus]